MEIKFDHRMITSFFSFPYFVVPGVIGCLQAIEVIKIATKMNSILFFCINCTIIYIVRVAPSLKRIPHTSSLSSFLIESVLSRAIQ